MPSRAKFVLEKIFVYFVNLLVDASQEEKVVHQVVSFRGDVEFDQDRFTSLRKSVSFPTEKLGFKAGYCLIKHFVVNFATN